MLKKFFIVISILLIGLCYAEVPELRGYNEYKIPAGYFLEIMPLQEFSTAYTEEGEQLNFVTTNDLYLFNKNVIPQGTKLTGYIEKKNEPVRGTHGSMVVKITKLKIAYLYDGTTYPVPYMLPFYSNIRILYNKKK